MTQVEETGHARIFGEALDVREEIQRQSLGEPLPVQRIERVQSRGRHAVAGLGADRGTLEANVDPEAVRVGITQRHLLDLAQEIAAIGRGEIEMFPTRLVGIAVLYEAAVIRVHRPPAGVAVRGQLVPQGGQIDRRADARALQGSDLRPQQVEGQRGVHLAHVRRMIAVSMVAFREQVDGADLRVPERCGEPVGVEPRAHVRDAARGVEIQVDLAPRPGRCIRGDGHGAKNTSSI